MATYTPTCSPLTDLPVGSTVSISDRPTGASGSLRRIDTSATTPRRSAAASASASALSLTLGALGVNSDAVQWAPSAQLLAVGSLDRRLRLLSALTCRPVAELDHSRPIASLLRAERSRLGFAVEPRDRNRNDTGREQKENAAEDDEMDDEQSQAEAGPVVFWEMEEKPLSFKDCINELNYSYLLFSNSNSCGLSFFIEYLKNTPISLLCA